MTRTQPRPFLGLVLVLGFLWPLTAANPAEPGAPDLSEFKTVDTALTTTIKREQTAAHLPGYLGVLVETTPQGNLSVSAVQPDPPPPHAGAPKDDPPPPIQHQENPACARLRPAPAA